MVAGKATNSVPRRRQNPLFSPNCQDCRLLTEARGQLTVSGGGARKSDKKTIIRMKGPATLSKATSRCEGTVDYHCHIFISRSASLVKPLRLSVMLSPIRNPSATKQTTQATLHRNPAAFVAPSIRLHYLCNPNDAIHLNLQLLYI